MKIMKKTSTSFVITLVLGLALVLLIAGSLPEPLLAGVCAIGGCNCGSCENCVTSSGRIPIPIVGVSVIYYSCSCPGSSFCEGAAN